MDLKQYEKAEQLKGKIDQYEHMLKGFDEALEKGEVYTIHIRLTSGRPLEIEGEIDKESGGCLPVQIIPSLRNYLEVKKHHIGSQLLKAEIEFEKL